MAERILFPPLANDPVCSSCVLQEAALLCRAADSRFVATSRSPWGQALRLLIVSWYFPPANAIGAVRVGKLARFLRERGHAVRVVAARDAGLDRSLPLEIPPEHVRHLHSPDVNALPAYLQRLRKRWLLGGGAADKIAPGEGGGGLLHRLAESYIHCTNIPDRQVGWLPGAVAAGGGIIAEWRPDLIYASGPPFTGLVAGRILSRRHGIPWVAELRDRWADDPYFRSPPWRRRLLKRIERMVLGGAAGLVTVSEPWARCYRSGYGLPVAVASNGFDPRDFPEDAAAPPFDAERLTILYTGVIYCGFRDPRPLFAALRLLGPLRDRVRAVFVGAQPECVIPAAEAMGVGDLVEVRPAVPYAGSLALQRRADVLLLMQWNDPREQGNCPAKLFEYLGARRPVLGLGLDDGVPAAIIRGRGAGRFSNAPEEIAAQLRRWLADKDAAGGQVPPLPSAVRQGLSRDEQFAAVEDFCRRIAAQRM